MPRHLPAPKSRRAFVVLAGLLLVGCTGQVPDAQQPYAPADGVMADKGSIRVANAMVVAPEDADDGVINMTVINRGDQPERLVGVTSDAGMVELSTPQELGPNRAVNLVGEAGPVATIRGLDAEPGETVTLELTFETSAPIRLRTLVIPASGEYASITPPPPSPGP